MSSNNKDNRLNRKLVNQFENNLSHLLIENYLNNPRKSLFRDMNSIIRPNPNTAEATGNLRARKTSASPGPRPSTTPATNSMRAHGSMLVPKANEENVRLALQVQRAVANKKVFSIHGSFPLLRDLLIERGWVQKLLPPQLKELSQASSSNRSQTALLSDEAVAATKLLIAKNANFIWSLQNFDRHKYDDYPYHSRLMGRPLEYDFTRKAGLVSIYSRIYWFELNSRFEFIYPRCYPLNTNSERRTFVEDFHLTQCTSFLHYLCKLSNMADVFSLYGSVTSDCISFALTQVRTAIAQKNHHEVILKTSSKMFDSHAQAFHNVVQNGVKIRIGDGKMAAKIEKEIKATMSEALKYFPYIPRDGFHNLWIIKPVGNDSGCGYGIAVLNDEEKILEYAKEDSYIVQKYIEHPLLVYNTKFDIRQYFLITMDQTNINVWMYRNCYLKFSSQEFSLVNLSRSIHVTNHTVQRHLANGERNENLPPHNMWVLSEFQEYLRGIGKPNVWEAEVYPGMKHVIRTVINATLDEMEHAKNNFQLFGADFMITGDFKPILIEVNAAPDLSHSTVCTKAVCRAVVKDLLKVVLDNSHNKASPTGDFELIWSLEFPKTLSAMASQGLVVNGKSLRKICSAKKCIRMRHDEKMSDLNTKINLLECKSLYAHSLELINEYNELKKKKFLGTTSGHSLKSVEGNPARPNLRNDPDCIRMKEIKQELLKSSLKENYNKKREHGSSPLFLEDLFLRSPASINSPTPLKQPAPTFNSFFAAIGKNKPRTENASSLNRSKKSYSTYASASNKNKMAAAKDNGGSIKAASRRDEGRRRSSSAPIREFKSSVQSCL